MNEQNATIKPYVIGLDLGGTNSVFGIVDARGEIKATTAIKTGNYPTARDVCSEREDRNQSHQVVDEDEEKHRDEIGQVTVDLLLADGLAGDVVAHVDDEHLEQRLQSFGGFLAALAVGFCHQEEQN